jgi:hypothetical protein
VTASPRGVVTRGTTHPHRLRRVDAWLLHRLGVRWAADPDPVVVDLGYGATATTTLELAARLARVNPQVRVIGVEIDRARVAQAQPHATGCTTFVHGGFDLTALRPPIRPRVIRAFNVLRQYPEAEVADSWAAMCTALTTDGFLIDGTCDEVGRRAIWIELGADAQPRTLTFAVRFGTFERPSDLADRLPKALIHRNTPGSPVHRLFARWDRAWDRAAPQSAFGTRQRWIAAAADLKSSGVAVLDGVSRHRLGELTVDYSEVRP